jgi:hypothetical protein
MPTVPTTFVPQVAPGGAGDIGMVQAPQVAVTENLAAQQQVQFGRAMTQAGDVAFRIGSAIQDAIDESEAKAADTAFIQQANTILRGQNGYLRSSGRDAESRYAETVDSLTQMGQGTLDGLRNDTQRAMVRNSMSRNMMTFQAQILDHRDKEVKTFTVNESRARAEQYGQLAIEDWKNRAVPMSEYAINLGVAENEIRTAGRALGWTDDSAQMQAAVKQLRTQVTDGVVNRMMLESNYDEAYQFVKAELKAGNLEEKAAQPLLSSIDANRDRWMIDQYATTIKGYGRVGMPEDESNNPQDAPASLREALQLVDKVPKEYQAGVSASLRTQYAQEDALVRQEKIQLKDRVTQFLAIPGNRAENIPPGVWGRLEPADQAMFLKAQRDQDDIATRVYFAQNPQELTRESLDERRHLLTPETYLAYLKDLNAPDKIRAATVDADQFKDILNANGMRDIAQPGRDKTNLEMADMLITRVKDQIDVAQQRVKRELSREEKAAIMRDEILRFGETLYIEKSYLPDQVIALGKMRPGQQIAAMEKLTKAERDAMYVMVRENDREIQVNIGQIPPSFMDMANREFGKTGRTPTFSQIAQYWIKKGRPSR